MIDCCIDSMSGTTSQPSMGAIVHSLTGTELDTGVNPAELLSLIDYWDLTRAVYAPFESTLRSPSSEVYYHEVSAARLIFVAQIARPKIHTLLTSSRNLKAAFKYV